MFDTEDFIMAVFCCIDDFLEEITQGRPLRQRGFAPSLTDSEVITMEIVGEFRGLDSDKDIWMYFRDHLVISAVGVITGFTLTPANGSEREAVWDIISGIRGLLIGDKGYISGELGEQLQASHLNLQTPKRSNMKDKRDKSFVRLLTRFRRLIETVIGQLCERFNFEKVRARDVWHLTSRLNRKLLAHTVCIWLNRQSLDPLQFEQLIPE